MCCIGMQLRLPPGEIDLVTYSRNGADERVPWINYVVGWKPLLIQHGYVVPPLFVPESSDACVSVR